MKATINCFSDNIILGRSDSNSLGLIGKELFKCGIVLENTSIRGCAQGIFNLNVSEKNNHLFLVVLDDSIKAYSDFIKNISETYNLKIGCNATLKSLLLKKINSNASFNSFLSSENMWDTPIDSFVENIETSNAYLIYFKLQNNSVIVAPSNLNSKSIEVLSGFIKDIFDIKIKTEVLKTFGISAKDVSLSIGGVVSAFPKLGFSVCENGLESEIIIRGNEQDSGDISSALQAVYDKLESYVYLYNDMDATNVVFSLLKAKNLTLSSAESITCGSFISSIIQNNEGASQFVKEGIVCYSNFSKENRLGVSDSTLTKFSSVSSETAYEMATNLLFISKTDLVVCTTGYASACDKPENKGLVYIAIGDKNAIHIYKNFFSGSRMDIIKDVCQACNYYLIKKLQQNDFHFDKKNV